MVHLSKYLFIAILFMSSTHATVSGIPSLDLEAKKISSNDIRAAKNLEDFYWSFRRQDTRSIKFNLARFKARKSKELKPYYELLKMGSRLHFKMKSKKITSCPKVDSRDNIWRSYTSLYKSKCEGHNVSAVFKAKALQGKSRDYFKNNFSLFSTYRNQKKLIRALKTWPRGDQQFVGNLLKDAVYKSKKLPHHSLLSYINIDPEFTLFIQKNRLFDKNSRRFITKEFTQLVKSFKSLYLKGKDDQAKEYLQNAISFYEQNSEHIDDSKAWLLFVTSGKKIARRDDFELAVDLFKLSEKTADEDQLFESKFQTLFSFYRDRELEKARSFIRNEELLDKFSLINSKLRFWIARIYEESKEYKKAKELYLEQIKTNPLSFYSILSLKNLRQLNPNYEVSLMVDAQEPNLNVSLQKELIKKATLFNIFELANTKTLSNFQAYDLRRLSANRFFKGLTSEESFKLKPYFLIRFFSGNQSHLHSFKVAYTNLNKGVIKLNNLVIKSLFPQKYRKRIQKAAPNIEDRVILSLIRQESAFNEKAKSVVGARGLMQIMPATGRQFKRNLKTKHLYSPQLNIKIGTKYLENLLRNYEGNLVFALAAYNAGPGNVRKWQKSIPFTQDVLTNVELIPFKETRKYVKLIYRNLFFYSLLDGSFDRLDFPINNSFQIALNDEAKH